MSRFENQFLMGLDHPGDQGLYISFHRSMWSDVMPPLSRLHMPSQRYRKKRTSMNSLESETRRHMWIEA
jgi:hypothetical protein